MAATKRNKTNMECMSATLKYGQNMKYDAALASVLIQLLQPVKWRLLQKIGSISARHGLYFCKEHNLKMVTSYIHAFLTGWRWGLIAKQCRETHCRKGRILPFLLSIINCQLLSCFTQSQISIGSLWGRPEFPSLFGFVNQREGEGGWLGATGKHAHEQLHLRHTPAACTNRA